MVPQQSIELELQLASEIRIDKNGIGTMSVRGTARVAGVDPKSLRYAFKGGERSKVKSAELSTQQSFKGGERSIAKYLEDKLIEDFKASGLLPVDFLPTKL
jgi:hypothetical protein